MADKGKKYTVGKIVAPVAKPKVKPKAKPGAPPSQYTLRVSDPNDKRLKMYEDSTLATGRAIRQNEFIQELDKMPMDKRRQEVLKGFRVPIESKRAIGRLEKENKKPYREGINKSITTPINALKGTGYKDNSFKAMANPKGDLKEVAIATGANVLTPRRKVVLEEPKPKPKPKPEPKPVAPPRPKPDPVEKLEIRPADTQIVKPKEEKEREVSPVKEPREEKRIGMGSSLQYPAMNMNILEKIKARVTGKNPMPYYTDKKGVKRYGSRGESNPQANYEKDMLKEGLNPKDANDKATLGRIEARYKTPSKEE
jgi:hypothetical protein